MGKFEKGRPRPAGAGRKKGSLNKKTVMFREFFEEKGFTLLEQIFENISQMHSVETQTKFLIDLLPYCYPKLSAIQIEEKDPEIEAIEAMSEPELKAHVEKLLLKGSDDEGKIKTTREPVKARSDSD